MASKTVTTMVDDIDGSTEDVVTCAFGLGDSHFEIDLSAAHREELENALDKFIAASRPVGGAKRTSHRRPAKQARTDRNQTPVIRQWAKDNGFEVSERGRIPTSVLDAFAARKN